LTLLNVATIVLLAFDIQALLYCGIEKKPATPTSSSGDTTGAVFLWITYVLCVAWDFSGVLCWMIWVRNLWGRENVEKVAAKWPIRTDCGGIAILACIMAPFIVTIVVIGCVVLLPIAIVKGCWDGCRGKRVKVVEAGEVEKGTGSESGSVTEVESFAEKFSE
jgi:hypothetical protein